MLKKELQELESYVEQLDLCLTSIYSSLEDVLSHPAKDYTLTFRKKRFELHQPFDKKEKIQVDNNRNKFIKLLLRYVLDKRIKKLPRAYKADMYKELYAFCYGEDPKNHKITQTAKSKVDEERIEKDKEYGKKRPLDETSYQVRMQDVNKVKIGK